MDSVGVLPHLFVMLAAVAGPAVHGYGIKASAPPGWHVRVLRGALEASTGPLPRLPQDLFPTTLRPDDVAVLLDEDGPSWAVPVERSIYRHGYPRAFSERDFATRIRTESHARSARHFAVAGRSFDLFVEAGSPHVTAGRLAELNALVRSLRIEPGDFYPGLAPPARFRPASGWYTKHAPTVRVGPETSSTTIASTVPYRDCLNCFPPHETVSRLPPGGIVIFLSLDASNRRPPVVAGQPSALRLHRRSCGPFEGIPDVATCALHAQVFGRYAVDGWVVFGRAHPAASQIERAQAELDRLVLPAWPRWPAAG